MSIEGDCVASHRPFVAPACERARENIVGIRRDDQPLDRKAHLLGDPAGENIAEIAGRHGEGNRPIRRAERRRRS